MSLAKLIAWYTLNGKGTSRGFMDNFKRKSTMWYFYAEDGNKTIIFNYRIYGGRVQLYKNAHLEIYKDRENSAECEYIVCETVTELKEALHEV